MRPFKITILCSVIVLVLLSSCSPSPEINQVDSTGPDSSDGETNSTDASELPTDELKRPDDLPERPEPNPINLIVLPEEGNSITAVIWPGESGAISVVDRDGNKFTLTWSENALLSPEQISMTPLEQVDGLPVDSETVFGVLFEPEGLIFWEAAELAIELSSETDLSDAFSFSTYAEGNDFHLTPSQIDGSTARIPVDHFSSSALSKIGKKQITDAGQRGRYSPSAAEAMFKDDWIRSVEAQGGGRGTYEFALRQWYWDEVQPRAGTAASTISSKAIEPALSEAIRWLRWMDIENAPLFRNELGNLEALLSRAFRIAFAGTDLLCELKDPEQALSMVRWMAIIDSLPNSFPYMESLWDPDNLDRNDAIQKIEDCFSFDLEFRSRIAEQKGDITITTQVALRQPLNIEFDAQNVDIEEVEISLPYELFAIDPPLPSVCTMDTSQGDVIIDVKSSINLSYKSQTIRKVWIEFFFANLPRETFTCGGNAAVRTTVWHSNFSSAHALKGIKQAARVDLEIGQLFGAYAKYEFEGNSVTGAFEKTDISLLHTPE